MGSGKRIIFWRLSIIAMGFVRIAVGLASIVSLSFWIQDWEMRLIAWGTKVRLRMERDKEES